MTSCDQKEVHQSSPPCTDKLLTPPSFIYICVFSQCKLNIESSFTFLLDLAPSWHFLGKWLLSGFWSWPHSARQVLQAWTLDAYCRATEFHYFCQLAIYVAFDRFVGSEYILLIGWNFSFPIPTQSLWTDGPFRCLEDWGWGVFFFRQFIHLGKRRLP